MSHSLHHFVYFTTRYDIITKFGTWYELVCLVDHLRGFLFVIFMSPIVDLSAATSQEPRFMLHKSIS
jgi:hypothetical protein